MVFVTACPLYVCAHVVGVDSTKGMHLELDDYLVGLLSMCSELVRCTSVSVFGGGGVGTWYLCAGPYRVSLVLWAEYTWIITLKGLYMDIHKCKKKSDNWGTSLFIHHLWPSNKLHGTVASPLPNHYLGSSVHLLCWFLVVVRYQSQWGRRKIMVGGWGHLCAVEVCDSFITWK